MSRLGVIVAALLMLAMTVPALAAPSLTLAIERPAGGRVASGDTAVWRVSLNLTEVIPSGNVVLHGTQHWDYVSGTGPGEVLTDWTIPNKAVLDITVDGVPMHYESNEVLVLATSLSYSYYGVAIDTLDRNASNHFVLPYDGSAGTYMWTLNMTFK